MSRESRRLKLQSQLETILGSRNVYFQPPASIHLKYPCIVYNHTRDSRFHADNIPYMEHDEYDLMLITKDPMPDDTLEKLSNIPYNRLNRRFVEDNLYHFSYGLILTERIPNE